MNHNDVMVDHPKHYKSETGLEAIDVIEAFTFDLKGIEATDTGNVLKYMCRWKAKNGLQDLKKAHWYLEHLINHVEHLEKENLEDITMNENLSPNEAREMMGLEPLTEIKLPSNSWCCPYDD